MRASRSDGRLPLSKREQQVAWLYANGQSHKEVARSLAIAPSTVRTHLNSVYRKLKVVSRIELLRCVAGNLLTSSNLGSNAVLGAVESLPTSFDVTASLDVLDRRLRLIRTIAAGELDFISSGVEFRELHTCGEGCPDEVSQFGGPTGRLLGFGVAEAARTEFVEVSGLRFAYRCIGGNGSHNIPIVFLNRFRASMDDWDPALINAIARDRRVILFDGVGVGESHGRTPASLDHAADHAVYFLRALGLNTVDLLGWSIGGMIAQIVAAKYPELVRKLVLIGTLPPGGSPDVVLPQGKWERVATRNAFSEENLLYLFFSPSAESMAAGRASLERISFRRHATEIKTCRGTMLAQYQAAASFFRNEGHWYEKLWYIQAPTLVASGDSDLAFSPINSFVLARAIPKAQLALYQDSGHGFQFQYPDRFAADLDLFLRH